MRESRTYGFVRGAVSNDRPYRDSPPVAPASPPVFPARRPARLQSYDPSM